MLLPALTARNLPEFSTLKTLHLRYDLLRQGQAAAGLVIVEYIHRVPASHYIAGAAIAKLVLQRPALVAHAADTRIDVEALPVKDGPDEVDLCAGDRHTEVERVRQAAYARVVG